MDSGVHPRLPNNAAADENTPATSTSAAQNNPTQSPPLHKQQHSHGIQHQPPPLPATYTTTSAQAAAAASTASSAFSPRTPLSAVSSLTNPPSAAGAYPASTAHDHTASRNTDGAATSFETPAADAGGPLADKKARACESCRGLKVRCEPDPANPDPEDGPCRRCAKAGRACVVTQPTRKRQKKTDSRVAELEKKIDALTASLHASRGGGAAHERETHAAVAEPYAVAARTWQQSASAPGQGPVRAQAAPHAPGMGHGEGRFGATEMDFGKSTPTPTSASTGLPPVVMAGQKRKFGDSAGSVCEDGPPSAPTPAPQVQAATGRMGRDDPDAIDRGVLTLGQANELWVRYTDMMAPHLPAVVFAPGTTAAEIRTAKPVLFLAIMAASSSELPSVQRVLTRELMQIFADKVIVVGEKSLELVQALLVATMWYWPPEHFEELKFYQLVHIAAVMAIDIGLGRKSSVHGGRMGLRKHLPQEWRQMTAKKHALPDPTSLEARRAWLACYFLATNTAMALHRPTLIRWNSFMTECVDVLESSPEAAPTDRYFCHLIWTHKLAEEVGIQFALDDPSAAINIADARTQYALRGFERGLEKYSSSVSEEFRQPSLMMSFNVLNLYMHEIAAHSEGADDWRQADNADTTDTADTIRDTLAIDVPLTPAHINGLSACLTAIDGIFEVFLSMDVPSIRCLPVFNFVRVAYAVVVLIKIYFAASSPKSELGKVIDKDNMKVEQHLDNLLDKFSLTAADEKNRPASKFLVVLVMLRSWFQKQKGSGGSTPGDKPPQPGSTEIRMPHTSSPPTRQSIPPGQNQAQQQQQQPDYSATANTPLQLLSEVATKDSNGTRSSSTTTNALPTPRFHWPGRQPQPPFMYDEESRNNSDTSISTPGLVLGGAPPTTGVDATPGQGDSSANNFQFSAAAAANPWLDAAAGFDFTSIGLGDGFAQAMDLTLAGLANGSMMGVLPPGTWDSGSRYVLQDPAFPGVLDGMGMGPGGGAGAPGGAPGGGGGYHF